MRSTTTLVSVEIVSSRSFGSPRPRLLRQIGRQGGHEYGQEHPRGLKLHPRGHSAPSPQGAGSG